MDVAAFMDGNPRRWGSSWLWNASIHRDPSSQILWPNPPSSLQYLVFFSDNKQIVDVNRDIDVLEFDWAQSGVRKNPVDSVQTNVC